MPYPANTTPEIPNSEKSLLAKILSALGGTTPSAGTIATTLADILTRERRNLGEFGSDIYADTSAHTGTWCAVQVVADAVFTTFTIASGSGTWTGVTFPAGFIIRGSITAITLTSGSVIAVKSS